jgi:hypothetical protein
MRFIRSLALCNTVVPHQSDDVKSSSSLSPTEGISFACDSPVSSNVLIHTLMDGKQCKLMQYNAKQDEESLVLAAASLGIQLYHR